ncbi:helix-turn-helix domain-containing protein [Clavibacter michiganensis]|uniref:helix-turn-helix domain-containing protein n=1 Tax=Clavibacter michiganensis TaxID=28447 RepID=UPI002930FA83|nr:helix-turn-helix domain-containing protein [Clavibacter michiganensis]
MDEAVADVVREYRTDDVDRVAERLEDFGVTAADLRAVIGRELDDGAGVDAVFAGARLHGEPGSETDDELMRIAVLAEERVAVLRRQITVASRVRYAAIQQASDRRSVVEIARRLGVSRQKVSQIVNESDVMELVAMARAWTARKIEGER